MLSPARALSLSLSLSLSYPDNMEADFLVIGTKRIAPGAENRASMRMLGSTALYASQNCKCHAIVVKPAINHAET